MAGTQEWSFGKVSNDIVFGSKNPFQSFVLNSPNRERNKKASRPMKAKLTEAECEALIARILRLARDEY